MARCFYHPLGEQTAYTYDLAGRVLTEDHSDRGLTTTTYDKASNVMEISTPATQSFGGSITMNYDFNRLVSRLMPNSSGMDLYDIQYTYGYKGDGRNGAGRVVKVEQGQTFKIDDLRYDELGQSAEEVVSIDVPMQGGRMFTTRKFYDSFGRILQAGYPDGDKVDYQYNALGELSGINSTLGGVTQPIITAISYNGYGQISLLTYGNGTSTTYSYASGNTKKATTLMSAAVTGKEQGGVSPTTLLSRQYAYNKQGMVAAMDRSIAGSLLSQSSVVNYHDSYSYDAFGRLEGHQQLNGTTPQYDLTMSYNKAGGITFKDGNGNGFMNAQSLNYNLEYGYSPAKPHQLEHIWDADNAITTQFQYNTSGSITQIDDPSQGIPQEFYWNEAQQLTGVKNQQGVHHYIYDHQGERIMKSSLITSTVYLNDQVIDDVNNLDPYTVYVNPFYVVTGFMGGDRVSKHYCMNQQRVATDISINYDPNGNGGAEAQGASPRANAQSLALVDLSKVLRALEQPELDTTALTLPRMESVYPELQPSSTTSTALTENITNRILFWYHPDYLGNVDLVTEKDGYAYEFFVYTPWGEEMHQWNANTFNFSSPYRFNGKELDPETGLAYYGARYYHNKIAVWLSVDPKTIAGKNVALTPYQFTSNSPISRVDPDGMDDVCETCPKEANFDIFRTSPTEFVYDQQTNEVTGNGGVLNEVIVGPESVSNTSVLDAKWSEENTSNSIAQASGGTMPYYEDAVNGSNLFANLVNTASSSAASQPVQLAQRGLDATADAANFAKVAKVIGRTTNGISYASAAYQVATGTDNTSTWVDVGVTTAGIITVGVAGTVAAPFVAGGALVYGIWSLAGGSDWINENWGYRE